MTVSLELLREKAAFLFWMIKAVLDGVEGGTETPLFEHVFLLMVTKQKLSGSEPGKEPDSVLQVSVASATSLWCQSHWDIPVIKKTKRPVGLKFPGSSQAPGVTHLCSSHQSARLASSAVCGGSQTFCSPAEGLPVAAPPSDQSHRRTWLPR